MHSSLIYNSQDMQATRVHPSAEAGIKKVWYTHMEYTRVEYMHMEYMRVEYTRVECTRVEYTRMEYTCMEYACMEYTCMEYTHMVFSSPTETCCHLQQHGWTWRGSCLVK